MINFTSEALVAKFNAFRDFDFWGTNADEMLSNGGTMLLSSGVSPAGVKLDLHAVFTANAVDIDSAVSFVVTAYQPNGPLTRNLDRHQASESRRKLDAMPVRA
jgi:hypothetical protein